MKQIFYCFIFLIAGFSGYGQEKGTDIKPLKSGTVEIYDFADVNPKFPGGEDSLKIWIDKNFKYPESSKKTGVKGKVYVRFEVLKDGRVVNPRMIKGLNEEIDKELLRILKKMPNWSPGEVKGKVVIVRVVLPIEIHP